MLTKAAFIWSEYIKNSTIVKYNFNSIVFYANIK